MREIKLRIRLKKKENGEELVLFNSIFDAMNGIAWFEIDRKVWSLESYDQWTGLLDKNEKEIYSGDIITFSRFTGNWILRKSDAEPLVTTHKVVWDDDLCRFGLRAKSIDTQKLRKHWGYEYEVIGNIYDGKKYEEWQEK